MHFGTQLEFAPRSLHVRFKLGTAYEDAKQFLEGLGLAVQEKDRLWDIFCATVVTIPEGHDINDWLSKIPGRTRILYKVSKMMSHHADAKLKTA